MEYFEEALDAASELAGVDGGRVAMVGNSKGEKEKGGVLNGKMEVSYTTHFRTLVAPFPP